MNREHLKDWLEGIGIAAIVASLIFVGLQLKQSQDIAESDGDLEMLSSVIEFNNAINEHAEVWRRGSSGEELNETDAIIFTNLVADRNYLSFYDYLRTARLNSFEAAQISLHDFTAFLYQNPGARRVWEDREANFVKFREILIPDGNPYSFWQSSILADLEKLDQTEN
jgi:hypothetical protein